MSNLTTEEAGKNFSDAVRKLIRAVKASFTTIGGPMPGKLYEEIIAGDNSSILLKGRIYDGPVVILTDRPEIIKTDLYRDKIPIVRIGSENEIIGNCMMSQSGLQVKFKEGANVTKKEFFKMFGCGATLIKLEASKYGETDFENYIIVEATIKQFIWEPA